MFISALMFPFRLSAEESDTVRIGRRSGIEIGVSAASAMAVNAAVTELLKGTVHEMRPDRSSNNSFPSRHTSWAFAASTVLSNELYRHSPWWSAGAQTVATAVGLQRVRSRRHYGSDVVAGAVTGILSTELSYWIVGKLFHSKTRMPEYDNDFRPAFSVTTEAVYSLGSDIRTGFGLSLKGEMPFTEKWGATLALRTQSSPVKTSDFIEPLNSYSLEIGAVGHFRLQAECLAVETSVEAGAAAMERIDNYGNDRFGFQADCSAALSWRLTGNFAFRANVGYRLTTIPTAVSALVAGVSSVVLF